MTVYPPQQVLGGDVILDTEVIKELRRSCLTSHHRSILRKSMRRLNHAYRGMQIQYYIEVAERFSERSCHLKNRRLSDAYGPSSR